ncbi:MAG: nuclear transport factor 2 family protein [Sphingobium sp.]
MADMMTQIDPAMMEELACFAVSTLICRERLARDNGDFDAMASYYHPDSWVDISWFQGSGQEFVDRSRANYARIDVSIHLLSPPVVTVDRDRAIAEQPCINRSFFTMDGIEMSREGFTRLLWRAQKHEGRWLIAGLRAFYIRDILMPCTPGQMPPIDEQKLAALRPSYRHLDYALSSLGTGLGSRVDLPGSDRPETVAALRAGDREWLAQQ